MVDIKKEFGYIGSLKPKPLDYWLNYIRDFSEPSVMGQIALYLYDQIILCEGEKSFLEQEIAILKKRQDDEQVI